MITLKNKNDYLHNDGNIRVWQASDQDYAFILHLCKMYRNNEFFYVPDSTLRHEITKGNILAFDYNVFEAGYIWVTFPRNGRSRINQLAVDPELWRNKVGSVVTSVYESLADKNGMWAGYLSCNTNTPGHHFWPTVGWQEVCRRAAGRRGGDNIIWGKLLPKNRELLLPKTVPEIKTLESYKFQSSISDSKKKKKAPAHFKARCKRPGMWEVSRNGLTVLVCRDHNGDWTTLSRWSPGVKSGPLVYLKEAKDDAKKMIEKEEKRSNEKAS